MTREASPPDLTDAEWRWLVPHLPAPKAGGRPRRHAARAILPAMCYRLRRGGAWRLWPQALPPWKTVDHDCRLWRVQGLWERLHAARHAAARVTRGRAPHPTGARIDRQAGNTTRGGGPRGDDGGKHVNGRTRPLLVDTQGVSMRAVGHPADLAERDGATRLLAPRQGQRPRVRHIWADRADGGNARAWGESTLGCTVELVTQWGTGGRWGWGGPGQEPPTIPSGFQVVPRR